MSQDQFFIFNLVLTYLLRLLSLVPIFFNNWFKIKNENIKSEE